MRRSVKKLVSLFKIQLRKFQPSINSKEIKKPYIHESVIMWSSENIKIHETAGIYEYSILRATNSNISIGENTQIGPFTVILGGSGVYIDKNVMIAPHCVIAAGNHDYMQLEVPMRFAGSLSKGPIYIEEDVWISANCTISDNVRIKKGAVVGANSFVNKDVNEYDIVGGVPAKVIGNRKIKKTSI